MTTPQLFADPHAVIVAIDHPMYMWPTRGLEDRAGLIAEVVNAGADAVLATYGTLRDYPEAFGAATRIMKLDTKALSVGQYQMGDHTVCWTIDDALAVGAHAVLTFIQVGLPDELPSLDAAARVATECDRAGIPFLCEIMPIDSPSYPDPYDPAAIAACARAAAELGAHAVKTSIPNPAGEISRAVEVCQLPIYLAGGEPQLTEQAFLDQVRAAVAGGAHGVAVGRNIWANDDPGGMVKCLSEIVRSGSSIPA